MWVGKGKRDKISTFSSSCVIILSQMVPNTKNYIAVLGDGAWGSTLAILLGRVGFKVRLWGRSRENVQVINRLRENPSYLPGVEFPDGVTATASFGDLSEAKLILLAVPSRFVPDVLKEAKTKVNLSKAGWIIATKGIHPQTYQLMSEIVEELISPENLGVLSGPAIAREVVSGLPTALVVASKNEAFAKEVQEILSSDVLRIYRSTDVVGVELGGALKNVIAIACGICDGLGLGTNSKAALMTRAVSEMARVVVALGGRRETVYGISGLGDMITTGFSVHSRNRTFGEAIAKGVDPLEYLKNSKKAVEGAYTVRALMRIKEELKIDLPISECVYRIVYERLSPTRAIKDLMRRPLKSED